MERWLPIRAIRPSGRLTRRQFASLLLGVGLTGCARLTTTDSDSGGWQLPRPQMSPDSVILEVVTLRLPPGSDEAERLWSHVDEQHVSRDARIAWHDNGFRCGVIPGQLPAEFQQLIDEQRRQRAELDREAQPSADQYSGEQRLQNRAGKRGKILTTDIRDTLVVLTPKEGRLTGQTLQQAQCLLSVRPFPHGNAMELELTPEIEHGQAKQRWVGQAHEGTFRLDMNRSRVVFEPLRIRPTISPGQVLVLSCTAELKGLGRQFFAETPTGSLEHRFLLIRLAQTQLDDLFSLEADDEPLTTPID